MQPDTAIEGPGLTILTPQGRIKTSAELAREADLKRLHEDLRGVDAEEALQRAMQEAEHLADYESGLHAKQSKLNSEVATANAADRPGIFAELAALSSQINAADLARAGSMDRLRVLSPRIVEAIEKRIDRVNAAHSEASAIIEKHVRGAINLTPGWFTTVEAAALVFRAHPMREQHAFESQNRLTNQIRFLVARDPWDKETVEIDADELENGASLLGKLRQHDQVVETVEKRLAYVRARYGKPAA